MTPVRFRQLAPGYHENTEVWRDVAENFTVLAKVIYVNRSAEEVLLQVGGDYQVLSAQDFNNLDFRRNTPKRERTDKMV